MLAVMAKCYTTRSMIDALIAIPTVSRDSNLDLIAFIQSYLNEHGIDWMKAVSGFCASGKDH